MSDPFSGFIFHTRLKPQAAYHDYIILVMNQRFEEFTGMLIKIASMFPSGSSRIVLPIPDTVVNSRETTVRASYQPHH
jgi:hypothetical protein